MLRWEGRYTKIRNKSTVFKNINNRKPQNYENFMPRLPGGLRRGPRQRGKTKQSRQITSTPIQKDQKSPETLSKFLKIHAPPTWEAAERSPPEKKKPQQIQKTKDTSTSQASKFRKNSCPACPGACGGVPAREGKQNKVEKQHQTLFKNINNRLRLPRLPDRLRKGPRAEGNRKIR